jgi:hypothetical protein
MSSLTGPLSSQLAVNSQFELEPVRRMRNIRGGLLIPSFRSNKDLTVNDAIVFLKPDVSTELYELPRSRLMSLYRYRGKAFSVVTQKFD